MENNPMPYELYLKWVLELSNQEKVSIKNIIDFRLKDLYSGSDPSFHVEV